MDSTKSARNRVYLVPQEWFTWAILIHICIYYECAAAMSAESLADSWVAKSVVGSESAPHTSTSQSADSAWAAVFTSDKRLRKSSNGSDFEHFLREFEALGQWRRERGLRFWRNYPDDPRRYKWLIIEAHLSPEYPLNIEEWARHEASIVSLASPIIDQERRDMWDHVYKELREEF